LDKVKIALTILSIAIVVAPIAGLAYVYRNNPIGIVLPPQFQDLLGGGGSNGSQSSSQLSQSISHFQMPQAIGQPQYDSATGAFSYPFNFTNPLTSQISINHFSAEVVGENNTPLGDVSIQPINIAPGASGIINATGTLSQSAINQLEAEYQSGNLNISLENVTVNFGGINIQIPQINNIGSLVTGGT
jgi:hypothetical protein